MQLKKRLATVKYSETILFVFIWTVFFISPVLLENSNDTFNWNRIYAVWLRFSPFLVFSLINHFILIRYIFFKKKWLYLLSAFLLIGALNFSLPTIRESQQKQTKARISNNQAPLHPPQSPTALGQQRDPNHRPHPNRPQPPGQHPNQRPGELPPYISSVLLAILILGFDIGLSTSFRWAKLERSRESLEKERVKSELAFLRNQLSPHFFMNTLNNIHALIDFNTEEAKESIIRLSQLMRHLLYDSEKELIPLSKEVTFIQSYVDLMKMRFTEKVKVSFTVNSNINNIMVPPLLFTSLIENAFKYGVSYKQDSFITIELYSTKNKLCFNISNSKSETYMNQDEKSTGIGLENTFKRLDLLYPSKYQLNIIDTMDIFSVELKLPI
jgi:hypothetical protein